jgi:parallel beta-helix repeat protein
MLIFQRRVHTHGGTRMERRKLAALIIAIAVASVSVLSVLLYTGFFDPESNHGPIRITNDQEFTKENGVTGGSGTEEDPYIIEGWRMGSSGIEPGPEGAAVLVKDASSHFVIRNIRITGEYMFGAWLDNCRNGTIEDSAFTLCYQGVYLDDCENCVIRDSNLSSCAIGLTVSGNNTDIKNNQFNREIEGYPASSGLGIGLRMYSPAQDVTVTGNRFCGVGLDLDFFTLPDDGSSSGLTIAGDNTVNGKPVRFLENQKDANLGDLPVGQIIMFNCTNSLISQSTITQVSTAISLNRVDGCRISNCSLSNTTWMGGIFARNSKNITITSNSASNAQVHLSNCSQVVFEDNEVTSQFADGLCIQKCDNVTIRGNLIHNCVTSGTMLSGGENITVTDNIFLANGRGISASGGNVTVTGNTLRDNGCGIMASMGSATDRLEVFLNDFINNTDSADCGAYLNAISFSNEALGRGNYWSEYDGLDEDDNGIGDTPFVIQSSVQDHYPLMNPVNS